MPRSRSGAWPERAHVLLAERAHSIRQVDGHDLSASNGGYEVANSQARLAKCIYWGEKSFRDDLSPGDCTATRSDHVWLPDVTDQFADLAGREAFSMRFDDRRVPNQAGDVVVGPCALVLRLCLDESLSCVCAHLRASDCHVCHGDIHGSR